MTHTPGPWTALDQGEGPRGKPLGICVSDSRGLPMFFLPRGTPQLIANARLIAAAPDLLMACKFVADKCNDPALVQILDQAIAKAEGA